MGEVAWLAPKWRAYAVGNYGKDPYAGKMPQEGIDGYICTGCRKPDCPWFPLEIGDLSPAPQEVYPLFAERAGCDALVVSDKIAEKYEDLIAPGELEAIVLFRHPSAFVRSEVQRYRAKQEHARAYYCDRYELNLAWGHAKRKVFASWERLLEDPEEQFARLCSLLELPEVHPLPKLGDIPYHHVWGDPKGHPKQALLPPPDVKQLQREFPLGPRILQV